MTDESRPQANERTESVAPRRSCFDAAFFSSFLAERTRKLCARKPGATPVVLLHLADGAVLDVCHVDQLFVDWMLVSSYHDPKTCERMDLAFVPYALITRVTVSLPPVEERHIGFQPHPPAFVRASLEPGVEEAQA